MNSFPNLYIYYCTLPPWGPDHRVNIINRIYTPLRARLLKLMYVMTAPLYIFPEAWLFVICLFTTLITRLGSIWWVDVHLLHRWVYLNVSTCGFFHSFFYFHYTRATDPLLLKKTLLPPDLNSSILADLTVVLVASFCCH